MFDDEDNGYNFESKGQAGLIEGRYAALSRENKGYNQVEAIARAEGWSYRRQDMQADYRRFCTIEHSNSEEGWERARNWYDNIVSPFIRRTGMTMKRTTEYLKECRSRDFSQNTSVLELMIDEKKVCDYINKEEY